MSNESNYLRSLIETSLDPFVTINPDGKITDVNDATIKATGVSRDKLIGTDFSDYFTDPKKARTGYKTVFKKGFVKDYELTIKHINGSLMYVLYNATLYLDQNGKTIGVFAAARDVTARKNEQKYLRSLIETCLDPFVTINPDGKITDVNDATIKATGVSRDKLIGTDFSDYFTDPKKARTGYKTVFEKGFVKDYELTIKHIDGSLMHVLYNATLYLDQNGKTIGVFAAARDVTALKNEQRYLRSLIETSIDPFVTINPDGKITDVNDATIKATGVSRDKLIGTDFSDYFTDPQKARTGYKTVFKKGVVKDYELTIKHINGSLMYVLYNATLYRDQNGKTIGVFAAARDVTQILKGILPICSNCKKIRNVGGYWEQIEVFIRDRSKAEFSHTICPECAEKFYPDFNPYNDNNN